MNKLLHFLFFTLILIGCGKDKLENQNDFEKSYATFQKFKKETKNTYTYKTTVQSYYDGIVREYTFEIVEGVVTKRSFMFKEIGNNKRPETGWTEESARLAFQATDYTDEAIANLISKLEWVEEKDQLGTMEAPLNIWTLDQIYDKAKEEWLIKRANAQIHFETNNNGLISLAGYVPNGCQDDCFTGIKITKIEKLEN
ncbi:MAG TPA: hypothetical protein VK023_12670 [Sphingobacterium bovisgrunnientis]|jgi:hypothetical protein|nr:hypothetical protein [Sphingobacterium bovisgrunnientis]